MKAGDFVEALERFFFDVIGTVLPGLAMIVGICYVTGKPLLSFSEILLSRRSEYEWVLLIGFAYALGHGVTSLGCRIRKRLDNVWRSKIIRKNKEWLLNFVLPEKELSEKLAKDPIFKAFLGALLRRVPSLVAEAGQVENYRTWRSLALSITQENSHLVYRFTFLSLLNLGIATALILIGLAWLALLIARGLGVSVPVIELNIWLMIMLVAWPLFMERYYSFASIAFKLPFSMAIAKLEIQLVPGISESAKNMKLLPTPPRVSEKCLSVYLAGGFQSGWQDKVMQAVPELGYFDPRSHRLKSKAEYTAWDLEAVRRSDCVFAYLESTNPGGYALALEVGFASALGKFVILVDEKSPTNEQAARYLEMLTETSEVHFQTLQEGIDFLKQYRKLA